MKKTPVIIGLCAVLMVILAAISCSTTNELADAKTGAQLWGENCIRCHNAPAPETFSDVEWNVVIMHMQVRANLTQSEADKIVQFLKMAN